MDEPSPPLEIDGRSRRPRAVLGIVGRIAACDERHVAIRAPMRHQVRLRLEDLARALGGPQNALALFNDARTHDDAVAIRFETAGYAYHNAEQFMRFERARAAGNAPPFALGEAQCRAAARERETARLQLLVREELGLGRERRR